MNVNPFSKKSAAVTKPVKGTSPLNGIGDVGAVTEMFQRLRQQNAQYDQAIAALVAANRIKDGWDKPTEPEMSLTIQREVLVGLGDTDALARFDQEHSTELAQEQAERVKAAQQVLEAPTRVKALEQYINDLAGQIEAGLDESLIDEEICRIFRPSAQRMLEAAKTFVQAWREMQSVESVLLSRVNLFHYSVTGDHRTRYEHELIGRRRDGELLPTLIEGLAFEDLRDLNDQFTPNTIVKSRRHWTMLCALSASMPGASRSITPRARTTSVASTPPIPTRRRSISSPTARWRPWFAWMWREGDGDGNPFHPI